MSVRTDRQTAVGAAEGRPGDTLEEMDGESSGGGAGQPGQAAAVGVGESTPDVLLHFQALLG